MSDNDNASQPLTRRQIRERAEAERVAREAAASGPAEAQSAAPPAPTPRAEPLSRRSLRESGTPATPVPVVRAPAASGGMRSLDETGRLTPVHETAESVAIRPLGASPAPTSAPLRRSSTRAADPQAPTSAGTTPPPAISASGLSGGMPRRPSPAAPAPEEGPRLSSFSGAEATPASSFAPVTPAPTPTQAPAPVPELPWQTATPPAFPVPQEVAPSAFVPVETDAPFAPVGAGLDDSPFRPVSGAQDRAVSAAAEVDSPFDDVSPFIPPEIDEDRPRKGSKNAKNVTTSRGPSYTWLQYLILLVVAVVLGMLIWKLMDDGSGVPQGLSVISPVGTTLTAHPGTA